MLRYRTWALAACVFLCAGVTGRSALVITIPDTTITSTAPVTLSVLIGTDEAAGEALDLFAFDFQIVHIAPVGPGADPAILKFSNPQEEFPAPYDDPDYVFFGNSDNEAFSLDLGSVIAGDTQYVGGDSTPLGSPSNLVFGTNYLLAHLTLEVLNLPAVDQEFRIVLDRAGSVFMGDGSTIPFRGSGPNDTFDSPVFGTIIVKAGGAQVIPEPATYLSAGVGVLLGLGGLRRRLRISAR